MKVTPPSTHTKPEYSGRALFALATAATAALAVGCQQMPQPLGGVPPEYPEAQERTPPSAGPTEAQWTPTPEDSSEVRVRGRIEAMPIEIGGDIVMDSEVPDEPPIMGEIAAEPEEPVPPPPLPGKVAPPPPGAPVAAPEP